MVCMALHVLILASTYILTFTQIQVTQVYDWTKLLGAAGGRGGRGGRTYYIKVFEANNDLANGDSLFGY